VVSLTARKARPDLSKVYRQSHGGDVLVTILLFLFVAVFYNPLYRIAQSKGYPGATVVRWTAAYHATAGLILFILEVYGITHWQLGLAYLPVSLVLLLVQCLPARPGAPGRAWLTINTTCTVCHAAIAFDRSREGLVDSCPQCGEILTVSDTAATTATEGVVGAEAPTEISAVISHGMPEPDMMADDKWIPLRTYPSTTLAEMDRQALEAAGVPAVLQSVGAAGIFPTSLGTTLLVPFLDKERAESVLFPREEETPE
jgi:predicted RNA-binding Zn-ribbon protein involved in translation (DUF1610 family)